MGELAQSIGSPRDPGGQRHKLPVIYARMDAEDRESLWAYWFTEDADKTRLARIMRETYGADCHYTAWARWARAYQEGSLTREFVEREAVRYEPTR